MKKTFSLILLVFLSLAGFAQKEHLPFQGFPMQGDIIGFEQQLASAGWVYNEGLTVSSQQDCRVFKGRYHGSEATLMVLYTADTKTIHKLMLMMFADNKPALITIM